MHQKLLVVGGAMSNWSSLTTTISLKIWFVKWNRNILASRCYSHFSMLNEIFLISGFSSVIVISLTKLLQLGNREKSERFTSMNQFCVFRRWIRHFIILILHELFKGVPFIFNSFINVHSIKFIIVSLDSLILLRKYILYILLCNHCPSPILEHVYFLQKFFCAHLQPFLFHIPGKLFSKMGWYHFAFPPAMSESSNFPYPQQT